MSEDQARSSASGPGLRAVLNKAVQSGTSGAMAMTIQVVSLMWIRSTMNYQASSVIAL
jgi:hypothetical protein